MNIAENLPDLIKLQPLFKRVLGKLKLKDDIFDTEYNQQGFIVEIPDEKNNFYQSRLESGLQIQYRLSTDNLYRTPSFEELWEMVDHLRYIAKRYNPNTGAFVDCEVSINNTEFYTATDPYTCLLKALLKQEGL